jgi:hypothetical protein
MFGIQDPENAPITDKYISMCFFELPQKEAEKNSKGVGAEWVCICGVKRTKSGNGFSNLASHVKSAHISVDIEKITRHWMVTGEKPSNFVSGEKKLTITSFLPLKSTNIYSWIDWVVSGLRPFSFVEQHETREYTKLKPICKETLIKYLNLLTKEVENEVRKRIPEHFAVIFDGWSTFSYHFIASFASFCDKDGKVELLLLGFTQMCLNHVDEESAEAGVMSFDAKAHINLLEEVLRFYGKSIEDVSVFIGDNCTTNKRISDITKKPFVGCASHRLHLGVTDFLRPYEELLDKIENLMLRLRSLKQSTVLRELSNLRPVLRCSTRWSGCFRMIDRYLKLEKIIDTRDASLADVLLSPQEHQQAMNLHSHLKKMNSVTKCLQSENLSILQSRLVLDKLVDDFEVLEESVGNDARIIKNPCFENAIVKIQGMKEHLLSEEEKISVSQFLLPEIQVADNDLTEDNDSDDDYASKVLRSAKKRKLESERKSNYVPLDVILPVGDECERLFSKSGIAFDKRRSSLDPVNLEAQIYLHVNRALWNVNTVHKIVLQSGED